MKINEHNWPAIVKIQRMPSFITNCANFSSHNLFCHYLQGSRMIDCLDSWPITGFCGDGAKIFKWILGTTETDVFVRVSCMYIMLTLSLWALYPPFINTANWRSRLNRSGILKSCLRFLSNFRHNYHTSRVLFFTSTGFDEIWKISSVKYVLFLCYFNTNKLLTWHHYRAEKILENDEVSFMSSSLKTNVKSCYLDLHILNSGEGRKKAEKCRRFFSFM